MNAGVKEVDTRKCPEYWKPIAGIKDYEMSTRGKIRNCRNGKLVNTIMTGAGRNSCCVTFYIDGKVICRSVKRLMWETFVGPVPKDARVVSKSGVCASAELDDLMLTTQAKLGRKAAHASGKKVLKINKKGEVVKIYENTKTAGADNFYSHRSIQRKCAGQAIKTIGDYDFAYEDDLESIRQALTRLGVDWRKWKYE